MERLRDFFVWRGCVTFFVERVHDFFVKILHDVLWRGCMIFFCVEIA